MAVLSSVFLDQTTLNNHVSDTPAASNRIALVNLKYPGRTDPGDLLINRYTNLNCPTFTRENSANTLGLNNESGTFSTLQTGLQATWSYNKTQTGYVKIAVDGVVKTFEVKEYYHSSVHQDAVCIFEIIQDLTISLPTSKTAEYDFTYGDPLDLDNTMNAYIDGQNYYQTDNPSINIGTNGTQVYATYDITASDSISLFGDELSIRITVRQENSTGTIIEEQVNSSNAVGLLRVPATGNVVINDSQITGNKIWIQIQLGTAIPI